MGSSSERSKEAGMLDFLIRLLPWILLAGAVTILALIAK
jgi:hypothetical protein